MLVAGVGNRGSGAAAAAAAPFWLASVWRGGIILPPGESRLDGSGGAGAIRRGAAGGGITAAPAGGPVVCTDRAAAAATTGLVTVLGRSLVSPERRGLFSLTEKKNTIYIVAVIGTVSHLRGG
jgi:hypothetical protein